VGGCELWPTDAEVEAPSLFEVCVECVSSTVSSIEAFTIYFIFLLSYMYTYLIVESQPLAQHN
jgi:hypothetical protein